LSPNSGYYFGLNWDEETHLGKAILSQNKLVENIESMAFLTKLQEKKIEKIWEKYNVKSNSLGESVNLGSINQLKENHDYKRSELNVSEESNNVSKEIKLERLRRYFDPNVFEKLLSDPSILEPKNRLITIVFWDIRGFSKLSEILRTNPHLISNFLKEYCELAAKCIFQNSGVLDKFMGDGVMALFGALEPQNNKDKMHAMNAAKAAIQLRHEFDKLLDKWIEKWKLSTPINIDIGLGCGIHTGQAIVGNIGTNMREDYTALGASARNLKF